MEYREYLLDDVIRGNMYSPGAVHYLSIQRFPRGLASSMLKQTIEPIPWPYFKIWTIGCISRLVTRPRAPEFR